MPKLHFFLQKNIVMSHPLSVYPIALMHNNLEKKLAKIRDKNVKI